MPDVQENRRSILMIDDEPDALYFVGQTFGHFNCIDFHQADDPKVGIEMAAKMQPHLLITEIYFPTKGNFDGKFLIRTIKEFCPAVKIIICTTLGDEKFVAGLLQNLGFDSYFRKPYELEALIKKSFELLRVPYPSSRAAN